MPYKMVKQGNEYCIQKEDGSTVPGSCHTDNAMTGAMMDKLNQAMQTEHKAAPKFAVDANDNHPDKLPLGDKGQIEGAITSVVTGAYRGNPITPALTADEKKTAKTRIRAAISASGEADDWKKQELARLDGKELTTAAKDMGMMPMMKMEPGDPRAQYDPLAGNDTQACANCQWFCAPEAQCALLWGDTVATGKCNLWLGKPAPAQPGMANPIPVVVVEPPEPMDMGEMAMPTSKSEPPVKVETVGTKESPIITWLKQTFGKKQEEPLTGSGFKALPDNKWVSYYTNSFEDKTGQIFTEKAHDRYIEWLDKGQIPYPDLWYWHIPGTRHGQAEWIGRVDHTVIAAGSFDQTPMAQLFRKEYEKAPHTTSHTYGFPKQALQGGLYHAYFSIELSPLPAGKEANVWTPFMEVKEMPVTDEKRAKLEAILGKEMATHVLGDAAKMSADLEALGIKFKEAENIAVVDTDARDALKTFATANKEKTDGLTAQVTQLTAAVTKLIELNQKQAEQINQLTTGVKEMFSLQPRASNSPQTVVDKTNPMAAFLADKQADPSAPKPNASIGDQIAAMVLPAAKPA